MLMAAERYRWFREEEAHDDFIEEEEEEEDEQFFDSRDDMSSTASSCPDSPERRREDCTVCWFGDNSQFDFWVKTPSSVRERRSKFARWMGLEAAEDVELVSDEESASEIERIVQDDGSELRISGSENGNPMSSWSSEGTSMSSLGEDLVSDDYTPRTKSLDDGSSSEMDAISRDSCEPSLDVRKVMQRGDSSVSTSGSEKTFQRSRRVGWLRRLGITACVADIQVEEGSLTLYDSDNSESSRGERVKVRQSKKQCKEFSAVYRTQVIGAHSSGILTMKFCPDGLFLASGGEDGFVRVWSVMECEQGDMDDIPADDTSCIYFTANHNLELAPLHVGKEKEKSRSMKRSSVSACVVIPPEVFRLSEKPVHEFHGHSADILDLSWSKDKHLLSSSVDKTVRLWRVGCSNCLKVFCHNDYVTCIQFNPADENYFVSGSIDGKIRIWEIPECRVVDWTDIKDIITAVCYRPDGKGVVVGSMAGVCRFYDASDNHLELEAQISFQGKKKSAVKRITGFQFSPSDHRKLMVTSTDSQIRILDGVDVILKYKGLKNSGSQISASFTSDGQHIISASEDSSVSIWTNTDQNVPTPAQVKSSWSSERFFSSNVSVAIPWNRVGCGSKFSIQSKVLQYENEPVQDQLGAQGSDNLHNKALRDMSAGSLALNQEFFTEFLPRGSATWPEEKLPLNLASKKTLGKSHYKFLRTSCQNTSNAWGQVIVTGGWDGRIRAFQNYGLPVHT